MVELIIVIIIIITKKGKKNRLELQKECQIISAASLVNYMEKKKSDLRKLKKAYWRRKKQEKSRALNRKFELDPGRVYAGIKEIVDKNEEEKRPNYVETNKENEGSQHSFENIEEASSFWKALWEQEGSGDISAKWVEEVKSAINSRVAAPTDEQFLLTKEEAVNAIRKKRNWSAPAPDRITNYWWKKAFSLHEGVSNAFMNIVQHDHEYPL